MIETAFTPWMSLSGGILIGLASTLLMATLGRVLGATGILAGFIRRQGPRTGPGAPRCWPGWSAARWSCWR